MPERISVLLLYGGQSGEHEVSLRSAASVYHHLNRERYHVIPVGMDKQGRYHLHDDDSLQKYTNVLPVVTRSSVAVPSLVEYGQLIVDAEVVFPVVHGPSYEDGCLQGLLSFADVAYVGCPVLSSAIGMDKDVARRLACVNGVQSARYKMLSSYANADETRAFCEDVASAFGWPLFVKPCSMGSSVGIHKAHNMDALAAAVSDARRYDVEVVVEAFIQGREIELAVLENKNPSKPPLVSVPGEIRVHHPDGFYSYAAKYLESDQSILTIPADLDDVCIQTLQRLSADIFTRLKCRGMARIDFFVNPETQSIYFNEINTLPGFTSISMYPKLWVASGLPYASLLDELIDLAKMHHNMRQQLVTNYQ